jgi:hypothetical protein
LRGKKIRIKIIKKHNFNTWALPAMITVVLTAKNPQNYYNLPPLVRERRCQATDHENVFLFFKIFPYYSVDGDLCAFRM